MMNGAVEAANKNIKKIVQKMIVSYKDRHEMLSFTAWLPNLSAHINWGNSVFVGIQNGSRTAV